MIQQYLNKPYIGDWLDFAKIIPNNYVHLVVTSPPYFRARKYDVDSSIFGGDKNCKHVWGSFEKSASFGRHDESTFGYHAGKTGTTAGRFCKRCEAWEGELGLESTPQHYVFNLCNAFDPLKRILRDDGLFFLNIGDKFADKNYGDGIKKGEKIGIPWLVALELRRRGWHLEQDNIWAKPNAFREPNEQRCINSHEYIFQFTKNNDVNYWVHRKGVKNGVRVKPKCEYFWRDNLTDMYYEEPPAGWETIYLDRKYNVVDTNKPSNEHYRRYSKLNFWKSYNHFWDWYVIRNRSGSRKNDVWSIATQGLKEAHFAPFPETLPEIIIKAGSSEHGCCSKCLSPYHRIIVYGEDDLNWRKRSGSDYQGKYKGKDVKDYNSARAQHPAKTKQRILKSMKKSTTKCWVPTCSCNVSIQPCIVLDPFGGSFTTARVAERLGRWWLSCDLSDKYVEIGERLLHKGEVNGQIRNSSDGALWV